MSSKEWETENFADDYFLKLKSQYINKIKNIQPQAQKI